MPVVVARPTIAVDGTDRGELAQALLSLHIVETSEGLYRCEASFGNWGNNNGQIGFLYFDRRILDFGKAFSVRLNRDVLFEGRIMGLEGRFPEGRPPEIAVLAEDRLQDLRMTRRTRTFTDSTDAQVFERIASDHSLTPSVNLNGPQHKVLTQVAQSDLAFLRERARALDAEVWVDGRTLHAQARSAAAASPPQLTYLKELREVTVLADLAHQRSSVKVTGWDTSAKHEIAFEASDSAVGPELNGDTSGARTLEAALSQRKELIAGTVPFTSAEAQSAAEAYFRMRARRFVVARGVAEPDPRLRVGGRIGLNGLGPLFSGTYYVAEVEHEFDGTHGLRTCFSGERPGLGSGR